MKKFLSFIALVIVIGVAGFVAFTWPWAKLAINAASGPPVAVADAAATREPIEPVVGDFRPLPRASTETPIPDFKAADAINEKYSAYSLLVWHNGAVIHEKYWGDATADSRPESASMHKSAMASLLGIAIAEGHIGSVDDPVGKYIPEWANDPRGKITLRQTLHMATGLAGLEMGGLLSQNSRFGYGLFMRQLTFGRELTSEPGTVFDYRNPNSQMLGYIIEATTKKRYADYLSEKMWKPLGAKDAYVWLDKPGGMARTSGSLLARTEDWLRVGIMLKDSGQFEGKQVVPAAWVEEMIQPSPANPSYGFQLWRATPFQAERYYNSVKRGAMVPAAEEWLDPDIFFFDGFGGQRVYISRKHNLVIAREGAARMDWDDTALPNEIIRAITALEAPVEAAPEAAAETAAEPDAPKK